MHFGGHEDGLIRNDLVREEIQEVMTEVFGDHIMGFKPSKDLSTDPFTSDSDSDSISEEDESRNTSDHDAENVEGECNTSSDESAVSFSGPDFELIDSDCPPC